MTNRDPPPPVGVVGIDRKCDPGAWIIDRRYPNRLNTGCVGYDRQSKGKSGWNTKLDVIVENDPTILQIDSEALHMKPNDKIWFHINRKTSGFYPFDDACLTRFEWCHCECT